MPAIQAFNILGGDFGALTTLGKMRGVVNRALLDPVVLEQAHQIIEDAGVMGRNEPMKVLAIHQWLADHLQFIPDPRGVELLKTPRYQVDRIRRLGFTSGDCDDAAILAAAFGKAVGLKARFRALGFGRAGAAFRHVITDLCAAGRWVNLDVTRSQRADPPVPSRVYVMGV